MGKINSRAKGAAGEREWARFLTERGFPAIRGRQFTGSSDSPDVRCEVLEGLHHEVKRVEQLNINDAMSQSTRDAGNNVPIVAHRRNGERWKVTLWAEDFLDFFAIGFLEAWSNARVRQEKKRLIESLMQNGKERDQEREG